jgi:hypothetical protein
MGSAITSYLIQAAIGAGGGWLGNMLKANGLGTIGNILAGVVGGVAAPNALGALGMLGSTAAATGGSGFDIMSAVTALAGGGVGSLVGGLFKKA